MTDRALADALRAIPADRAVRGIVVSPDVFERIQRYASDPTNPAIHCGGIEVFVNRMLAPGTIVPVDSEGKPLPKGAKVSLR